MNNFQRIGAISNAHVGREFEEVAIAVFADKGITVQKDFYLDVGIGSIKKPRNFDLGSQQPSIIVECKAHRWTAGNNVPSAKMTVWNEANPDFF
ncbi:MAG: hypothetical protein F6K62_10690 [Sphaerospermopsis sp. SIO1G2]|nr:hypothetical protein [Sphaerospermopsis sp. SIO1G2]